MFKIIVITPEKNHPHEEQILHALVRACGVTIHLRKPDFTEEEYRLYLTRYPSILSHIVLHEHHILAKEFSVKGIHLKEADRKYAKEIHNDVKIISTSFHNIEDVKTSSYELEYFFYSPLFKSISKENYGSTTTQEELTAMLAQIKKKTDVPVIGLGGINGENIASVKKSGFDGAALLGALWQSEDPLVTYDKIYSCLL